MKSAWKGWYIFVDHVFVMKSNISDTYTKTQYEHDIISFKICSGVETGFAFVTRITRQKT
jgi:hypothetical protein